MVEFVNPYTFVSLPGQPKRGRPGGHGLLGADRFTGTIGVRLRTVTPLLVGGYGDVPEAELRAEECGGPVQDLPRRRDRSVFVPGSSVLGAVRSLHEALVGGCLRVVDEGYVPVHRHPANSVETRPVQLAIVSEVDGDGLPVAVVTAARTGWISTDLLRGVEGAPLTTGDRLRISGDRWATDNGRLVLVEGDITRAGDMSAVVDGTWAVLATDTKPRGDRRTGKFVAGLLGPDSRRVEVQADAGALFRACVDKAEDVRVYRRAHGRSGASVPVRPEPVEVRLPAEGLPGVQAGPVVGRRLPARPFLFVGQPVWVRVDAGVVTEVRLSLLWRFRGDHSVGERVGAAGPCWDPADLCPSCQVFGSVDEGSRGAGEAAWQRSYRGHVRVDDALSVAPVQGLSRHLAPLSAPRPSAGQFYLDNAGRGPAGKDKRPAAVWGSEADDTVRPIRGRKFYWRTEAVNGSARGQAREHQKDAELVRRVRLVEAGARFVTRVTFENLTRAQVGGLLAALDPRLLFGADSGVVGSLGGGKPCGFGAVTVDVSLRRWEDARSRYLGDEPPAVVVADLVEAFHASLGHEVRRMHGQVRSVLRLGAVPDELVWYPPGDGQRGDEAFDQGFDFWQKSAGVTLGGEVRPLVSLPAAELPPEQQVMVSPPPVRRLPRPDEGRSR